MYRFALCAAVLLLGGCTALADHWTTEVVEQTDRGAKPSDFEKAIGANLEATLKDPFSYKIKNVTPPVDYVLVRRTVTQFPTLINVNGRALESRRAVWLVTADVNGKNSYGAYIGWRRYEFSFVGEAIVDVEVASQ